MPCSPLDRKQLLLALALAEASFGLSEPNPRVGCVIGDERGELFGRGATQQAGSAHAEVMALRDAGGRDLRGATAWVSLEPCAHHGRTPPCCDALIEAGIGRVVVATVDPFPQVAGAGIARLRAAGVQVEMADEDIARAAHELNIGFFSRVQRQLPWTRLKIAASLDGRTALANGVSQWITGPEARRDGHAWRRRASAVLSGIGTVLADDPRLDVRLVDSELQPLRVVVDSHLRTPLGARLLPAPGRVLIYGADDPAGREQELQEAGAEIALMPGSDGEVDLPAMLADLAGRGVNELQVEAGARLNAALLGTGLVDELLVYLAPRLLGPGREMVSLEPLERLADGLEFEFVEATLVGRDLRLRARARAEIGIDKRGDSG